MLNFLANAQAGGGMMQLLIMLPLMFLIFYFLLIRPQQKQQKAFKEMIASAGRGDEILTTGGIIGKITKTTDTNDIEVEIAPSVIIKMRRTAIAQIINSKSAKKAETKTDKKAK